MDPETFDQVFERNSDIVEEFTYITADVSRVSTAKVSSEYIGDKARINTKQISILGVLPNVFSALLPEFLEINSQ